MTCSHKKPIAFNCDGTEIFEHYIDPPEETIKKVTFEEYMVNARTRFVNEIQMQDWNTRMRTEAESLLIAYDQMREKILELTQQINTK